MKNQLKMPCPYCGAVIIYDDIIKCRCGKVWEDENKFYADGHNEKLNCIKMIQHSPEINDMMTAAVLATQARQYLGYIRITAGDMRIHTVIDGEPYTFQNDRELADYILEMMR